jgi:tetratricopeptide (TPR) repeat protein
MPEPPSIDQLERRVKADPTSIAFAALAEEYRRAGRFKEAIEVCRTGLTRHPAYLSARVTLGRALIEVGQLEAAKAELERVLKAAPENLAAIRGLAEIHHRRGETLKATEHYQSALEIAEHNAAIQEAAKPSDEPGDVGLSRTQPGDALRNAATSSATRDVTPPTGPVPSGRDTATLTELERWLSAIKTLERQRGIDAPGD